MRNCQFELEWIPKLSDYQVHRRNHPNFASIKIFLKAFSDKCIASYFYFVKEIYALES